MYLLDRDLAVAGIPVTVTCRVLCFSKQAYYQWCAKQTSGRDVEETHLIDAAYDIHAEEL